MSGNAERLLSSRARMQGHSLRPLPTRRPFTPQSHPAPLAASHSRLQVLTEEAAWAGKPLTLPKLLPDSCDTSEPRLQFRRSELPLPAASVEVVHPVIRSVPSPPDQLLQNRVLAAVEKLKQAQADEAVCRHLDSLVVLLSQAPPDTRAANRKAILSLAGRHLAAQDARVVLRLVDLILVVACGAGSGGASTTDRSPKQLALTSKLLFKLARSQENDVHFQQCERTLDLYLAALGCSCPDRDADALVYGYGALKFLTLNSALLRQLQRLGLLDLTMLHLKLLTAKCPNPGDERLNNVAFQMTCTLRNLLDEAHGRRVYLRAETGLTSQLASLFALDVDVACNLARILSVLTADPALCLKYLTSNEHLVDVSFSLLGRHRDRRDLVVRLTFCLGNLAAVCDSSRFQIAAHPDASSLLPDLLHTYLDQISLPDVSLEDAEKVDLGGSSGSIEDTAVKVIRVFANCSLEHEAGSALALCEPVVEALLRSCNLAAARLQPQLDLLLAALAALNNLSFYPLIRHLDTYRALTACIKSEHVAVLTETVRVLGNLSRRADVRLRLSRDEHFATLMHLLEVSDRQLMYACAGVFVNLLSDCRLRCSFRPCVARCIKVLSKCLHSQDWALSCLMCQMLWNYTVDVEQVVPDMMDTESSSCLQEELLFILHASATHTPPQTEQDHLCQVAVGLLTKLQCVSPPTES